MSGHLAPVNEQVVRDYILRAMEECGRNMAVPGILRKIAGYEPELFLQIALRLIESEPDCPGRRLLARMLLRDAKTIPTITDPGALGRENAIRVSKRLMAADSCFDVALARQLPDRDGETARLEGKSAERALDILDEVSPGVRINHLLAHLAESSDRHIASKATLLVGRRIQNMAWIERRLSSADPRIRANLLESIWGLDAPEARRALMDRLDDENNRVVGNAIMGLFLLEKIDIAQGVSSLLRQPAPFRATAAWIMGQTCHRDFTASLRQLMRDAAPEVRRAALQSLFSLRRAAQERPGPEPGPPRHSADHTGSGGAGRDHSGGLDVRLDGRSFLSRRA